MSKEDRNYAKEISQISRDVEVDLFETIKECMSNDIFEREDLSDTQLWYKFPYEVSVTLDWSEDPALAHSFVPEGTVYPNGYVVPEGGMIYTDHSRGEELVVRDLHVWGMIDMVEELKHMLKNKRMSKEELVEKWGVTGILSDLSDEKKYILASLYESMAKHIIGLDLSEPLVESIVFPIMYRIINNGDSIDSVTYLYKDIVSFFNENIDEVLELQSNYDLHIDAEAELIGLYMEHYINQNKDE